MKPKSRIKVGSKKGNPGYRTSSVHRFKKSVETSQVKGINNVEAKSKFKNQKSK